MIGHDEFASKHRKKVEAFLEKWISEDPDAIIVYWASRYLSLGNFEIRNSGLTNETKAKLIKAKECAKSAFKKKRRFDMAVGRSFDLTDPPAGLTKEFVAYVTYLAFYEDPIKAAEIIKEIYELKERIDRI